MESDEIRQVIKGLVAKVTDLDPGSIADDASFATDLELDSLALIEIGVHVDHTYQLKLTDEEMKSLGTVDDAVEMVLRKQAELGTITPRT